MAAEFLISDDQQKIGYAGFCNIKLDTLSKYLTLNPVEEDFKPLKSLSASFNSVFIHEKTILSVFSIEYIFIFAIILKNESTCSKILEIITKYKTSQNEISMDSKKKTFNEKFVLPLMEQKHNPEIRKIISILQPFNLENNAAPIEEGSKKENLYPIFKCSNREENSEVNESNLTEIIVENDANVSTNSKRPIGKAIKRKVNDFKEGQNSVKDFDYADNENFSEEESLPKSKERINNPPPDKKAKMSFVGKIIKRPEYEIIERSLNGQKKTRLIIFISSIEKQRCYEYSFEICTNKYLCLGCKVLNKTIRAVIFNFGSDNEYVQLLNDDEHICQPREYETLEFLKKRRTIYSPNYEIQKLIKNGIERKTLIIFELNNRELCYKYTFNTISDRFVCSRCHREGKGVVAKARIDDAGKEYIELRGEEHVCKLQPYQTVEDVKDIIFEGAAIRYFPRTISDPTSLIHQSLNYKKLLKSKLFIFDSTEKEFGYEFSHTTNDIYQCLGCHLMRKQHKVVTVKLCQKENDGEYYVRMRSNQKHLCEQRKYMPEKLEEKIILPPNFKFYNEMKNLHLIIFSSEDQKECYDYQYSEGHKYFNCNECQKQKVNSTAKVCKDINSGEYVRLGINSHGCDPIKFSNIVGNFKLMNYSGLKLLSPKTPKIDETKIIKEENFELRRNKKGDPDSKLIVFGQGNRDLCYEYFYRKCSKRYFCCKCITVSAKIYFDSEGKRFLKGGDKEHTCEPIKFEPEKPLIKPSNYIILNKDVPNKTLKLIIFTSPDRKLCYKYSWDTHFQKFKCQNCLKEKKYVTAKIQTDENGNEYVQLSKFNHVCSPKEYQPENHK